MNALQPIWRRLNEEETLAGGVAIRFGLLLGIVLIAPIGVPRPEAIGHMLALMAVLGLALRWRVGPLAIAALFVAGAHMRIVSIGDGHSDAVDIIRRAIEIALGGGNPYLLGTPGLLPDWPPFPYGPVALGWYAGVDAPRMLELGVSFGILIALAVRGRVIGLALFALAPTLLLTAADGSNDHSAGLLLLAALLIARRNPMLGSAALAVAVAFKPYALAWLAPLIGWAGLGVLVPFVVVSAGLWVPVLLLWGVAPVVDSFARAESVHKSSYYSLAQVVEGLGKQTVSADLFNRLRFALGAGLALMSIVAVRSHRAMILAGAVIFLATLFAGYWASPAYLTALAPVVCWHLDEWLGIAGARVRWAGDPVGRLTAIVDRRWPVRPPRDDHPSTPGPATAD